MRRLYQLLIGLYLIYLLIPFVMGIFVEHQYTKTLYKLSTVEGVKIVAVDYDKGWYGSKAIAEIEVSSKNSIFRDFLGKDIGSPSLLHFTVILDVQHGPFIKDPSNSKRSFGVAKCFADIKYGVGYQGKIDDTDFWSGIQSVGKLSIDFDQYANLDLRIESDKPVNIDLIDGNYVKWNTLSIAMYISTMFDQFKGVLLIDDMQLKETNNIKIEEFKLYFDNKKITNGSFLKKNRQSVWLNNNKLAVKKIEIEAQDKELNKFEVHNLNFSSFSNQQNVLMNMVYNLSFDEMIINEEKYSKLDFELSMDRLDPALVKYLQDIVNDSELGLVSMIDFGVKENIKNSLQLILLQRPRVTLKSNMVTEDGDAKMSLNLEIGGNKMYDIEKDLSKILTEAKINFYALCSKTTLFDIVEFANKQYLQAVARRNGFNYDSSAQLHDDAQEAAINMISWLIKKNLVKDHGDQYESFIEANNGSFILNKQPVSVKDMVSLAVENSSIG